jgi:hypothetical protein
MHPASSIVRGDELVLLRSNGSRLDESLTPSREIRDRRGYVWTLREKRLTHAWTARHLAPRTLARAARGWLVFENGVRRIVVTPPPMRWQELDDLALICLLERHAPRRVSRRRSPV